MSPNDGRSSNFITQVYRIKIAFMEMDSKQEAFVL